MSLHPKQIKLLELLEKNQEDAFSISQLAEALNFESNNSLRYHLQQLEKKGFLQRNIPNHKSIDSIKPPPNIP
jgi:predicted ArsR family transcriptional regulator